MNNFLLDLSNEIFGKIKLVFYIAYFVYVFFGILLSSAIVAIKTRNKNSTNTPKKFSIIFLIQDNLIRILASLSVVFLSIRFGEEYFNVVPSYIGAIALGFSWDLLIILLEKIQLKARQFIKTITEDTGDTGDTGDNMNK